MAERKYLKRGTHCIYTDDLWGGIQMLIIDWGFDYILKHGKKIVNYKGEQKSIAKCFYERPNGWYETLSDCANKLNPYTHLEWRKQK